MSWWEELSATILVVGSRYLMDHLMCVEASTDTTVIIKKIVFPYRHV